MFKTIPVNLKSHPYPIVVGHKWIDRLPEFMQNIKKTSSLLLVADEKVFSLYGELVLQIVSQAGFRIEPAVLAGGEENKNLAAVARLYEKMINTGMDRDSAVLALGGGIVGDIAGFAAASYMRGIQYIQIPTTLLAQVDSSIGGKTGVNLLQGKNLVGAFHQPQAVFIDTDFLKTLPEKEYLTGLAEVIKYGIMWDQNLFAFLNANQKKILDLEADALQTIIARSGEIKAEIVAQDEKEQGLRALLNLGHTFGHAFETLTGYKVFTHGEAVAAGMVYAAKLSKSMGLLKPSGCEKIISLIQAYRLPIAYGDLKPDDIVRQMYKDKKNSGGKIKLIIPISVGKCEIINNVSPQEILNIL